MRIIRDEEFGGVMMIPLFVDWGIRRCNVAGCTNKPNTIIANVDVGNGRQCFGLCEEHFQQGNVPGGTEYHLEFDDFDAFAVREEPPSDF